MSDWTRAVAPLLSAADTAPGRPRRAAHQPALQLDLVTDDDRPTVLRARPVAPRSTGGWQVAGTSWASVGYTARGDLPRTRRQRRLLTELLAVARSDHWSAQSSSWLDLTEIDSRRVWDLLCELRDAGLPFVTTGRPVAEATVHDPVLARLDVHRAADGGFTVEAGLHLPDGVRVPSRAVTLGDDAALAWWVQQQRAATAVRLLHVAPVPAALTPYLPAVRGLGPVQVPAADVARFVEEYLPRLPAAVTVTGPGLVPPAGSTHRTTLRVTVEPHEGPAVDVRWAWRRGPTGQRDPATEDAIVDAVRAALPDGVLPAGGRPGDVPSWNSLPAPARLIGMAVVRFVEQAVPALQALDGVEVEVLGELPRLRAARQSPVLVFDALRPVDRDWYDLTVAVTVEGEPVPFGTLFTALVRGDDRLMLPSGLHFGLRTGRFAELITFIEESRQVADLPLDLPDPVGAVRVSRYDADAWARLERLGVVEGRAAGFRAAARAVVDAPDRTDQGPPAGLTATLRPYQRSGFGWLAALYEHRLGGVLADDMGLGKTLQALALVCHVREHGLSPAPFLVVAPTSVVATWQREAARFAPGLTVVTVTGTARRRGGRTVTDLAAGADVVVTSYALFRLEQQHYRAVEWAGLVLDEAQSVKNHTSVGYRGAFELGAPFVLAITGTPLENTLLELWALLTLVAPGLLPTDPQVFNDVYRLPIERARDGARLDALRRRIGPLMLRRTKEQVAPELPAKTEQVLEVDLAPRHHAAYQVLLQRERTKLLGLVDDLPRNRFRILRSLTLLRQAALDVALVDPDRDPLPATKLDVLRSLVDEIAAEGHRVLVFSQFTRFLRAAQGRLTEAGHEVCYLDGGTTDRQRVIDRFRAGTAPAFLISLKAGGTGLTLTEADYVVVLDPWWNPATEAQAVDRTHRIGQTRPVVVYRLVAKDTIEEKVMALKAAKSGLAASVLDGDELGNASLTADDVRMLVG